MDERATSCDFTFHSIYRKVHQLKICSNAVLKRLNFKIEQNTNELQALNILIKSYSNKLAQSQRKNSIERAKQLAADLDHIESAIKSHKIQIAYLKSQILPLEKELAKYPTPDERSDAEKEIQKLTDRLLNNNQKQNSLKTQTEQLKTVVTDMLLKRQQFLTIRKKLIAELMAKKREINEMIQSNGIGISKDVNKSHNKSVQHPTLQ